MALGENLFRLRNLLLSLFEEADLRMFVHLRVDESLLHCLPVGVSPQILAYRACVAFEQRGHLDAEFLLISSMSAPTEKRTFGRSSESF